MDLSYFHVAGDVPKGLEPETAVVIDVLRATTTIAWALHNGAEAVETFADLEQLKKKSHEWPQDSRLLVGERGGKRIEGFDLGNSPVDVLPSLVRGKRLFMSTTNGTRSLDVVRNAGTLYTMALPNRRAVAERLLCEMPNQLCIIGSGWEGTYSLEDSLAAGALAAFLLDKASNSVEIVNDELTAALALWDKWKEDREGCLRLASHGRRLIGLGDHDADFKCCSELDQIDVVPFQVEVGVLSAS
ncbi:2-phosphosulfolactate phosphatase family protein [Prochlorococcus sp. MIT 1307]|uniref:2-phosphosulfolactate phosphatase family protein n=1 Tax=Prochlorococcus sp. MIT 1307 TaxID=3096219 RepID=UPI002A750038|nr:2-phosphosulfolactate phosphatase family protein [Prochlorococcus sp. MIT 1307]